ncbi:MAG: bifunctional diaminohydroxyphosphoribosylaminopyrimidine deaminase/5-amino-6-(5-phosphoribosylamino)uracil reductase RibD [Candidatus Sericytochromatia bacterium]|nr:bifunctional diaminohydroxyphosphoribosylaminopyrimidine deaminase/5-amino-6-(5-phosphoribosylamino)uracil reductase RibD [Candidatus Sericytochromatia bacterium]
MNWTERDRTHMRRALGQAALGWGWSHPNPMVGAVVADGDEVISTGYHARPGAPHAEAVALAAAGERARGATLYVTLEPCNHFGRTPPCTTAVVAAGIRRVVAATADPHPHTAGQACHVFRAAGLCYEEGLLGEEARELNADFLHWAATGRPRVILKMAATLDGRVATSRGESRWITGPEARAEVQRWRARVAAVMVGGGTARADDPRLDARIEGAHQPLRILVTRTGRIPPNLQALRDDGHIEVWGPSDRPAGLADHVKLRQLPPHADGGLDLAEGLAALGQEERVSVMVEGGGELAGTLLRQGLVDELRLFLAPYLLGGTRAPSWFGGPDPSRLDQGLPLSGMSMDRVGRDLLVTGKPVWSPDARLRYDGAV